MRLHTISPSLFRTEKKKEEQKQKKKKINSTHKTGKKIIRANIWTRRKPMTLYTYKMCMHWNLISLRHVFMNVDKRHVRVQKVSHLSFIACVRRHLLFFIYMSITNSKSARFFPTPPNFQSVKKDLPIFDVLKYVNIVISDSFGLTN